MHLVEELGLLVPEKFGTRKLYESINVALDKQYTTFLIILRIFLLKKW